MPIRECVMRVGGWVVVVLVCIAEARAQSPSSLPSTKARPDHVESERVEYEAPPRIETPPLPEGMTLDDVLDRAGSVQPADYPDAVADEQLFAMVLIEQLEYRAREEGDNALGWEAQGWIGGDYDKFWWKSEGEIVFDGAEAGESENDFLYSKLITPFWNAQVGVQYANEWASADYDDRWSGVLAVQGMAPGMFEVDGSLYVSDEADVTFELEAEYDIRITQRLVLQPRAELGFAAQDVPERALGAGMTDMVMDLRLRYEIRRELAPYVGVRYHRFVGETAGLVRAAGVDDERLFLLAGVRIQF